MSKLPTYSYADGSANLYTITPDKLTYDPVTPEQSSTGTYSGGEPATVTLRKDQYDSLRTLFQKAIGRTESHMADRIKTSGQISVDGKQYILTPKSEEKKEIEEALKKLLGR